VGAIGRESLNAPVRDCFAKYKIPVPPVPTSRETSDPVEIVSLQRDRIGRLFRILQWISLAMTLGILFAILRQAPALPIQSDPQVADRVAEKVVLLQQSIQTNRAAQIALNEAELSIPAGSAATVEEVQSAVKDLRMSLAGNQLRSYALFHIYGKDISL